MREEGVDLRLVHLGGVEDVVKADIASESVEIGLLPARTEMAGTQGFAQPIAQPGSAGTTNLTLGQGWRGSLCIGTLACRVGVWKVNRPFSGIAPRD